MSTVSKQVSDRVKISRTVVRAIDVHAKAVATGAAAVLHPQGDNAQKAALERHARDIGAALGRTAEALREADLALAGERADDDDARSRRDHAEAALRTALVRARDGVRATFGQDALTRVGLTAGAPDTADAMVLYAQNAARLLASGAAGDALDDSFGVDANKVADALQRAADAFSQALTGVEQELREEQELTTIRDQAMGRWQRAYSAVATMFEALAQLAGEEEIAERVRPTARRRAGLPEPIDELESPESPQSSETSES